MNSAELKDKLDRLISDSSYHSIGLGYLPPSEVKYLLMDIEDIDLRNWDDFESNGWDLDFWFNFQYKDTNMTFAGSWYYGKYSIYKN